MKTRVLTIGMLLFLLLKGTALLAQSPQQQVPGDNFSLEGALELFKKSTSPEEFERLLNSPENEVNNLDLNGDGDIDYIRVIDRQEGNVHAFILQAVISETEFQDIAVIALEKLANGKAVLQITGDADIYGIETIIEPTEEVRINAGTSTMQTVVNVWAWPSVQYVYGPYYDPWISPWHWTYRPIWWNPWQPVAYITYYPRWDRYRPYYSVCYTPRVRYTHYRPHRSTSVVVYNRHQTQITTYRNTRTASGYTRGRDQENRYDRGQRNTDDRSRSDIRDHSRNLLNERPSDSRTQRRIEGTQPDQERNRSSVIRDESTFRTRSAPENNRSNLSEQVVREVQRDDSRSRSNNTNPAPAREFRSAPDSRSQQQIAPQVERRQSTGDSNQRVESSGGNKPSPRRGRD